MGSMIVVPHDPDVLAPATDAPNCRLWHLALRSGDAPPIASRNVPTASASSQTVTASAIAIVSRDCRRPISGSYDYMCCPA